MIIPEIFAGNWNLYATAAIFVISILTRFIVADGYRRLLRQSEDMANSSHPLMKILRKKFDTCYELRLGVNNVDTFVDKYVYKHKILGIYMYTWENLCGQSFVFIILISVIFGTLAISYDCGKVVILSTLLSGIIACGFLALLDSICNFTVKREVLKVHIKDYLENICKPRLEKEIFHPEERKEYREEYFDKKQDIQTPTAESVSEDSQIPMEEKLKFEFTKEEQSIIEDVIKQYLV